MQDLKKHQKHHAVGFADVRASDRPHMCVCDTFVRTWLYVCMCMCCCQNLAMYVIGICINFLLARVDIFLKDRDVRLSERALAGDLQRCATHSVKLHTHATQTQTSPPHVKHRVHPDTAHTHTETHRNTGHRPDLINSLREQIGYANISDPQARILRINK